MRLLVELELIKDPSRSDDEDAQSVDNLSDVSQGSQEDTASVLARSELAAAAHQASDADAMLPPFVYRAEITETGKLSFSR